MGDVMRRAQADGASGIRAGAGRGWALWAVQKPHPYSGLQWTARGNAMADEPPLLEKTILDPLKLVPPEQKSH